MSGACRIAAAAAGQEGRSEGGRGGLGLPETTSLEDPPLAAAGTARFPFPWHSLSLFPLLGTYTSSESPETEPVCGRVSRAGLLAGMVELGSETGSIQTHCPVGSQGVGKELPPLCPAAMELYW